MRMNYSTLLLLVLVLMASSCNRVKKGAKETLNKSGELVGKSATEFAEGVTEGIDRTLDCEIVLSKALQEQGIRTGTFSIEDAPEQGSNNRATIYMVFDEGFNGVLQATTFTKKGLESGRATHAIEVQKGETAYVSFNFNKEMSIETRSRIEIE